MSNPRVSVIMSVYNGQDYLRASIDSILRQTFTDLEFIIIDDGSRDDSKSIITSYQDDRIRLVSRPNKGLTASLNEGLALAKGEFIARQDADDISELDRFEKEVRFLDQHPSVALVGGNYAHIDGSGKLTGAQTNVFTHPKDLKACLVMCNQYGHGSIMLRRSILKQAKGYDATVGQVEDYDLWVRISQVSDVANLPDRLYLYRNLETSISHSNLDEQIDRTFQVRDRAFEHFLQNRRQYSLFGWHPSGKDYGKRKATLLRDYALLLQKNKRLLSALLMLMGACAYEPRNRRNYRLAAKIILKPHSPDWEFEFL